MAPRDADAAVPRDPLAAYRRLRKPMPPPERIDAGQRRERASRTSEAEEDVNASACVFARRSALRGFVDRRDAGEHLAAALAGVVG